MQKLQVNEKTAQKMQKLHTQIAKNAKTARKIASKYKNCTKKNAKFQENATKIAKAFEEDRKNVKILQKTNKFVSVLYIWPKKNRKFITKCSLKRHFIKALASVQSTRSQTSCEFLVNIVIGHRSLERSPLFERNPMNVQVAVHSPWPRIFLVQRKLDASTDRHRNRQNE